MQSLFNKSDSQNIINRINTLTAITQSQWGKMNVSQMLAHCQEPLHVAFGDLKLKRGLIALLFGGLIKKKLTKDEQSFTRNLPTDKAFIVVDQKEFEQEKNKLIALVKKYEQVGPDGITKNVHPFFGKMTPTEWDIIQWKHLNHHLNQFGA
ncbi:MAG: DUF1569 domain-containing protein [Bacteroidota bacterium]